MSKIYLLAVGSSKKIFLEKNEVILGRGGVTGILDKRCSREQARINIQNGLFNPSIAITSLGINPLAIKKKNSDSFSLLEKQKMINLSSGDSFSLLPTNEFRYILVVENEEGSETQELGEEEIKALLEEKPLKLKDNKRKIEINDEEDEIIVSPEKKKRTDEPFLIDLTPTNVKKSDNPLRPSCKYGKGCFQKNLEHRKNFSHPGDDDYDEKPLSIDNSNKNNNNNKSDNSEISPIKMMSHISSHYESCAIGNPSTVHFITTKNITSSKNIAAFDMDGTLITTRSGKVHPESRADWKWLSSKIKQTLLQYYNSGYKIVIFTNQGSVVKHAEKKKVIEGKIIDIANDLGCPLQAYIAIGKDSNRKPVPTMWKLLEDNNSGIEICKNKSFYVGDAAGREAGWKGDIKRDFSCSDRKFASNVGVKFYTPEEFFDKEEEAPFEWGGVNPADILRQAKEKNVKAFHGPIEALTSEKQEMIIFVGMPASGKSSFSKTYLVSKGYVWINRDSLGTAEKCVKKAKEAISEGKSVVIDNTNPDVASRAKYIAVAKQHKVKVRCFIMTTPKPLALHLNLYRSVISNGKAPQIPSIAYNVYTSKYTEPTTSEGFSEIKKISFVPSFTNEHDKEMFLKWMD